MIEGLKRAVAKSSGRDAWNLDEPIEADSSEELEQQGGEPIGTPTVSEGTFQPTNRDSDYYVNLVRASIAMGGRLGDHSIPVSWLSMTLAGLEGNHAKIQSMWDFLRSEGQASEDNLQAEQRQPGSEDLFRPGLEVPLELSPRQVGTT